MKTHNLKTWPSYFEAIKSGLKTFEIRKDDRGFEAGDTLVLKEYLNGQDGGYTGRRLAVGVKYITDYNQPEGQVVMGVELKTDARTDLLDRIKALELELERAKADRNAEGVRQRAEYLPKLDRAHKALKLACEALEFSSRTLKQVYVGPEAPTPYKAQDARELCLAALAAIKACGVE